MPPPQKKIKDIRSFFNSWKETQPTRENNIGNVEVEATGPSVHQEIESSEHDLFQVSRAVPELLEPQNIMILGDLNADGAYVSQRKMKPIRIRSDNNFHWLIGDDVDTTANTSNEHTYDRIVVYGKDMLAAIVPNSAKTFNFHKEFGMTEEKALKVSDHYPVEVEIQSSMLPQETEKCSSSREALQVEVLQLQKENLLLEREKIQLQILVLKQRLAKTKLKDEE